jgi:hypothetical protein
MVDFSSSLGVINAAPRVLLLTDPNQLAWSGTAALAAPIIGPNHGPGVTPLDQIWIANYRRAVDQSVSVQGFPFEAMRQIFARLSATPHPWSPFLLPWRQP